MTNSTKTATRELAPFGELLVRLRTAAGLTQEQLAAQAGLSTAAITALESAIKADPKNRQRAQHDPDLGNLRSHPAYLTMISSD